jgi:ATP-binding cassette subfamily B protein
VTYLYNENKPLFDKLNIEIKPQEKVAIVGESGAGKSTFVKLLLRLYDVQSGKILIDDQNIKNVKQDSLRANIAFVPQDPAMFHRTIIENIRYGNIKATDAEVIQAAKLARCHDFIQKTEHGYQTMVGDRGIKLSGGERQRIAIARAILKNAPILVLDEATSSLDSKSEQVIQEALNNLMQNKTVIAIAHRLSTIRAMDRIIVVENGQVLEEGKHDELIEKDAHYAELWRIQSQ